MAYIGQGIKEGTFAVLDTSGNTYNGSNVTFDLGTQVGSAAQLLVSHDGVIQKPGTDYSLATGGTQITFSTAPASGASIFIVEISGAVGGPMNRDLDGDELVLDTDGDTTITADTDDQIDIKIAGADDFQFSANAMNVLSGSTLTIDSGATITNSGTANNFGASTLNDLTDVKVDIANFADGLLIQPNSDGSAPGTGTLSTATENIGIGHNTFSALTSGDYNTAYGSRAGTALNSGSENQLFGKSAGAAITTGQYNHIFGMNAGSQFDTESHNHAFGLSALGGPIAGGEYNIGIGSEAGAKITSGDNNVMMGYQAGEDNTSGYDNVFIGYQAGKSMTTGYKNVCIGDTVDVTSDNQTSIAIGSDLSSSDNNLSNRFIFGKSGNIVRNDFSSNANWARNSDERIKKNIKDQKLGLDFINDLRTVTFQWKPSYEIPKNLPNYNEENKMDLDVVMHGFIAQEVEQVMIKHGDMDFAGWTKDEAKSGNEGQLQHISREMFVIPLVKAVQELSTEVKELKEKLEDK